MLIFFYCQIRRSILGVFPFFHFIFIFFFLDENAYAKNLFSNLNGSDKPGEPFLLLRDNPDAVLSRFLFLGPAVSLLLLRNAASFVVLFGFLCLLCDRF